MMTLKMLAAAVMVCVALVARAEPEAEVRALLDRMHEATSIADHESYFAMFTADAVFYGTDIWERWELPEFEGLYKPYMQSGRGWTFHVRDRHVVVLPGGEVALFDETLYSLAYGQCRGTGAARLEDGAWKIASYHLDITIPNRVSTPIVEMIREHEADHIELMTFNIRYANPGDGANVWEARRELVTGIVRGERPDIVGFQEALMEQINDLGAGLPGYNWAGVGRDDGGQEGEFSPIFFNTDKLRYLSGGTFWFSQTPEVPGSVSYGNTIPRICTWGQFQTIHGETPRVFFVANVHLDHQSAQSRLMSVRQLAKKLDTEDHTWFVIGDFNCTPDSEPVAVLREMGFTDAVDEDTDVGTFHGFTGESDGRRIDLILMPERCEAVETEVIRIHGDEGVWPSDHYPVRAIVNLRPEREE